MSLSYNIRRRRVHYKLPPTAKLPPISLRGRAAVFAPEFAPEVAPEVAPVWAPM